MSKFIIIGASRSGTTMLINSLNHLERITCYGEILTDKVPENKKIEHWQPEIIEQRKMKNENCYGRWLLDNPTGNLHQYLDDLFSRNKWVGFKVLYEHYKKKEEELYNYFQNNNIKFIYIKRNDLIKQAISHTLKKNKQFTEKKYVNPDNIRKKVEKLKSINSELDNLLSNFNALEITYEEMTSDKEVNEINYEVAQKIFKFLGYGTKRIPIRIKKHWPSTIKERITNYEEIINLYE